MVRTHLLHDVLLDRLDLVALLLDQVLQAVTHVFKAGEVGSGPILHGFQLVRLDFDLLLQFLEVESRNPLHGVQLVHKLLFHSFDESALHVALCLDSSAKLLLEAAAQVLDLLLEHTLQARHLLRDLLQNRVHEAHAVLFFAVDYVGSTGCFEVGTLVELAIKGFGAVRAGDLGPVGSVLGPGLTVVRCVEERVDISSERCGLGSERCDLGLCPARAGRSV